MTKKNYEFHLIEIFIAILKIEKSIIDFNIKNSQDLYKNYVVWDSVIREFEIIGEATKILIDNKIFLKKRFLCMILILIL